MKGGSQSTLEARLHGCLFSNNETIMDKWIENILVCPRDYNTLERDGYDLVCSDGHKYPIVDDVPIMLLEEVTPTHELHTRDTFEKVSTSRKTTESEHTLKEICNNPMSEKNRIHQYVNKVVAATCGQLYKPLIGKLTRYPIPSIRLPQGFGETFLDIGCNWGRWSIAAAKKGYCSLGIDPSLDAIKAAKEISSQLNVSVEYIVADARYLPFAPRSFDVVFSYSVLQHFSKENVRHTLNNLSRVLKVKGMSLIQMPNKYGIRCLYSQARRGFKEPRDFNVRYWSLPELRSTFSHAIGPTSLFVDGYFGLGIQKSDIDLLSTKYQLIVRSSEKLRRMSENLSWMKYFADSIYVKSIPENENHMKNL